MMNKFSDPLADALLYMMKSEFNGSFNKDIKVPKGCVSWEKNDSLTKIKLSSLKDIKEKTMTVDPVHRIVRDCIERLDNEMTDFLKKTLRERNISEEDFKKYGEAYPDGIWIEFRYAGTPVFRFTRPVVEECDCSGEYKWQVLYEKL